MLVLSRRFMQSFKIGHDITITVVATGRNRCKIGIEAPPTVRILRSELEPHATAETLPGVISELVLKSAS